MDLERLIFVSVVYIIPQYIKSYPLNLLLFTLQWSHATDITNMGQIISVAVDPPLLTLC